MHNPPPSPARSTPAWQVPLFWLVAGIPAATVLAGITTVVIAHGGAEMQRAPGVRVTAQIQTEQPPPATKERPATP